MPAQTDFENSKPKSSSSQHSSENNPRDSSAAQPRVAQRKVAANRANALRSTGPKTPAGKNRVRENALKHGLLAKALFRVPIDGEDPEEFDRFLGDLVRDCEPAGVLEQIQVEGVAVCYWQLQRSFRCESGEIRRSQLELRGTSFRTMFGAGGIDDDLAIPRGSASERILRYRTAALKQLNYHLAELERLQRARRGDDVPAPISVQVGVTE